MRYYLKSFWWSNPCVPNVFNFGDLLTPMLLAHYCPNLVVVPSKRKVATLYGVGSIIRAIDPAKFSILLGSGAIADEGIKLPKARVYALRGELSKAMLGVEEDIPLGDPGLLAPYILPMNEMPFSAQNKPIAIIPHLKQYADKRLDPYRFDSRYKVINVRAEAEHVIRDICSCSCVISSSLHGLIIADAYQIPNVRLIFDDGLRDVSDFKYEDYYSAIKRTGKATRCITPEEIPMFDDFETGYFENIPDVQRKLDSAFRAFYLDLPALYAISVTEKLFSKAAEFGVYEDFDVTTVLERFKKGEKIKDVLANLVNDAKLAESLMKRYKYCRFMAAIAIGKKKEHYSSKKKAIKQLLSK